MTSLGTDRAVRLACQLRPMADVSIWPLVPPEITVRDADRVNVAQTGAERFAAILFVAAFLVGLFALPLVPAEHYATVVLAVWDGLVLSFLFLWSIGVLAELQRAGVNAASVAVARPSLDDVYLRHTGRRYRESGSGVPADRDDQVKELETTGVSK